SPGCQRESCYTPFHMRDGAGARTDTVSRKGKAVIEYLRFVIVPRLPRFAARAKRTDHVKAQMDLRRTRPGGPPESTGAGVRTAKNAAGYRCLATVSLESRVRCPPVAGPPGLRWA